jgi:hypothetical protein
MFCLVVLGLIMLLLFLIKGLKLYLWSLNPMHLSATLELYKLMK